MKKAHVAEEMKKAREEQIHHKLHFQAIQGLSKASTSKVTFLFSPAWEARVWAYSTWATTSNHKGEWCKGWKTGWDESSLTTTSAPDSKSGTRANRRAKGLFRRVGQSHCRARGAWAQNSKGSFSVLQQNWEYRMTLINFDIRGVHTELAIIWFIAS